MAHQDRTGPQGQGAKTGRRQGLCVGGIEDDRPRQEERRANDGLLRGRRRLGLGQRLRRGFGQGRNR